MKRFVTLVIAVLVLSSQPADAAPKTIAASEITKVASISAHEGAMITNQGVTLFSNMEKKVQVTSVDFTGVEKWKIALEGSPDQIAMAATSDKEGNIWLAGLTSACLLYTSDAADE